MPSQDVRRASRLSRRSLLRGAATAGAAGLAVTAIGAAATPAFAATSSERDVKLPAGPIMVHVRDAKTGDIEVFSGTRQTRLRDKHLAALIARSFAS